MPSHIFLGILVAGMKYRSAPPSNGGQQDNSEAQYNEIISLALETTAQYSSWISLDGSLPSTNSQPSNNSGQETRCSPFSVEFIQSLCQYALFATCPTASVSISLVLLSTISSLMHHEFTITLISLYKAELRAFFQGMVDPSSSDGGSRG